MKKLLMIVPLVFLLFMIFSCQQGEEVAEEPVLDLEADVEAIKDMLDEWVALYNAGDFEKLVSFYYAENAVSMPDNQPILEGREAILAELKKNKEMYGAQCDSSVANDVRVSGNMAMVRGNDTGTYTPEGGGDPVEYDSKWVGIFERQSDGTWKCTCEIGNSNLPPPTPKEE